MTLNINIYKINESYCCSHSNVHVKIIVTTVSTGLACCYFWGAYWQKTTNFPFMQHCESVVTWTRAGVWERDSLQLLPIENSSGLTGQSSLLWIKQLTLKLGKTNVCLELIFNSQELKMLDTVMLNCLNLLQLMIELNINFKYLDLGRPCNQSQ